MASLKSANNGSYFISGELDANSVMDLMTELQGMKVADNAVFDLSGVNRASSSGLAMLLELVADARREKRRIRFSGLPQSLLNLASMSNVSHLLLADK